jgi:hypothetical protein
VNSAHFEYNGYFEQTTKQKIIMDMEFKEEVDSDEEALSPLSHLSLNVREYTYSDCRRGEGEHY